MANLRVDKITSTETFETTGSVQFDGSGDYLDVTESNNDFDFDGDFTIEFWVYFNTVNARNDTVGSANNSVYLGASKSGWIASYYTLAGNKWHFSYQSNQAWIFEHTFSFTSDASRWYHVAFTREDSSIKCFVDGVQQGATKTSSTTLTSTENSVRVGGGEGSTSLLLNGYVSNLRVIKGKALYTSNFKPPMRELEVTPETVLLACQSKTDASLEKTGKTITVNGNAVASELTPGILTPVPKAGAGSAITGSVEFTSTNDALVLSAGEDFAYGTGDFTIEAWIQPQGTPNGETKAIFTQTQSGNDYIVFKVDSDKAIKATFGSTTVSGGTVEVGSWHHVAVTRASNTVKIFVNGVASAGTTVSTDFSDTTRNPTIGQYTHTYGNIEYYGFISNLRVVKGTALYTDDFIPPTRELKKVPGTVLLCCQDPDSPLTEATGKTITGYGDLGDGSLGGELVTNNDVWTLTKGGSGATDWTVSNNGSSLAGTTVSGGYMRATYTLPKGDYLVSLRWTGGAFAVQDSTGYIVATDGSATDFGTSDDGAYSFYMSDTTSVVITATSWSTAYTVDDISIKRIYRNNGASNFTPQVGDDRKVTLEGVTKINSDAYFYLPTGDTASREATGTYNAGTRGLMAGGYPSTDVIQYVTIASTGDAIDFGNLAAGNYGLGACASRTRGLFLGGQDPDISNRIQYVTIESTGNIIDFGDLTVARRYLAACSNSTRGVAFGGGIGPQAPQAKDEIDYVTIASTGDAQDFGDLTGAYYAPSGCSSSVRGISFGGRAHPAYYNVINYITIASTGDAKDFGDLVTNNAFSAAASNSTRGLAFGGLNNPANVNTIQFVTIASMGNAQDFGDLSETRRGKAASASATRAISSGGYDGSNYTNAIEFVTIPTTGNAIDFGNLTNSIESHAGLSNGHGGLG